MFKIFKPKKTRRAKVKAATKIGGILFFTFLVFLVLIALRLTAGF